MNLNLTQQSKGEALNNFNYKIKISPWQVLHFIRNYSIQTNSIFSLCESFFLPNLLFFQIVHSCKNKQLHKNRNSLSLARLATTNLQLINTKCFADLDCLYIYNKSKNVYRKYHFVIHTISILLVLLNHV